MNPRLTLACGDYDLTRALIDGHVEPKGVDLTVLDYPTPVRNWRMAKYQEFDVCEMSMGSYLASRSDPEAFPATAITVFPHRRFRHSYMFKHTAADIDDPGDLAGKRVGLRIWENTASIWMRGIAREHYGLDLESVTWYLDDSADVSTSPPDRFDIRRVPADTDLEAMLVDGELDAAMYPSTLSSALREGSGVERLFEDSVAAEAAYYEETGIFPIMHTVVIKDEVLETYPWLAVNVHEAFTAARDWCLEKLEDPRWTALVWARQHLEHQQSVVSDNPWPYGFGPENQQTLDKLQEYAEEVGLIPRRYEPEELFVRSTLDPDLGSKEYVSQGR